MQSERDRVIAELVDKYGYIGRREMEILGDGIDAGRKAGLEDAAKVVAAYIGLKYGGSVLIDRDDVAAAIRALGEKPEECPDCIEAAKHSYSDATTPGFFYDRCKKHREESSHER